MSEEGKEGGRQGKRERLDQYMYTIVYVQPHTHAHVASYSC